MNDPMVVTGAFGFAGSHLVDLLTSRQAPVIGWHRPGNGPPPNAPALPLMAVDMLDADAVRQAIADTRPTTIYHCAGAAHPGQSWRQAASALEINVIGTHYLFEAVRAAGLASRLLIPGSALVYRPSDHGLTEDSPLGPRSPYGNSKLAQELLGVQVAHDDALPVFLTRSFNHAGPRQAPSFSASSFAHQLARIEAHHEEPVIHVGNLDARRDFTDVRDVVRAYVAIVERGQSARVYNVCSERTYSIAEILDRLVSLTRVRVAIRPDAERMRPNDVPVLLGDARRIREEVGWGPAIPIERTLRDLLDYWRERVRAEES